MSVMAFEGMSVMAFEETRLALCSATVRALSRSNVFPTASLLVIATTMNAIHLAQLVNRILLLSH